MSSNIMHDILICIKGLMVISIVWFTDTFLIQLAGVSFINPSIREFFVETKEMINWGVSILVLIVTIVKLRKETKK